MKNLILSAVLGFALIFSTTNCFSQQLKIGHINSAKLLEVMPAVKIADSQLDKYARQLDDQNTSLLNEYQFKVDDFQKNSGTWEDFIKEDKLKEIGDLEARIQNFQTSAQEKLLTKKEELYNPILQTAENAIKAVAKEQGYNYVFDTSSGIVLYFEATHDIMNLVKTKLGL
ncbi:MAG: OmpH family outer membrane protein [Bacteroidetes bacterium]|nr:OmpH family outer membrane protein [Bacteroidota bacterium]